MTNDPPHARRSFNEAANPPPKRPPPSERMTHDLHGTEMARYVQGLEARLEKHLKRHAPLWQVRETREILARWDKPRNDHPAPGWAVPVDRVAEAANYARHRLGARCDARFKTLSVIRSRLGLVTTQKQALNPEDGPQRGGPSN